MSLKQVSNLDPLPKSLKITLPLLHAHSVETDFPPFRSVILIKSLQQGRLDTGSQVYSGRAFLSAPAHRPSLHFGLDAEDEDGLERCPGPQQT